MGRRGFFGPVALAYLQKVFDEACLEAQLGAERMNDHARNRIAKRIMAAACSGEHICEGMQRGRPSQQRLDG